MPQNTEAICFAAEGVVWNFLDKDCHVSTANIALSPPGFDSETKTWHQ